MTPTDSLWDEDGREAAELALHSVRDMIVDCFTATHGPRFGQTRAALGLDDADYAVRSSVEGMVKLAFTIAGGSFEEPTIECTARVVNMLAERSAAWGVSESEIFEHHSEMMRALGRAYLSCEQQG